MAGTDSQQVCADDFFLKQRCRETITPHAISGTREKLYSQSNAFSLWSLESTAIATILWDVPVDIVNSPKTVLGCLFHYANETGLKVFCDHRVWINLILVYQVMTNAMMCICLSRGEITSRKRSVRAQVSTAESMATITEHGNRMETNLNSTEKKNFCSKFQYREPINKWSNSDRKHKCLSHRVEWSHFTKFFGLVNWLLKLFHT